MMSASPYIRSRNCFNDRGFNWLAALLPVVIWSVFMFGARVLTLCLSAVLFALVLDYPIQRYIFKFEKGARVDVMTAVYSVIAVFSMPVTVPLWMPAVSSILVVFAKNLYVFRPKRLLNPFIFSAAVLNFAFPRIMTAFTVPFAYFSPVTINLDPKLVEGYRVISPLQYISDGSVYEDGLLAQLYGFASGNLGEIAVAGLIIAFLWLYLRREANHLSTIAFVAVIFGLAFCFPSDDAESNHYVYSILLSGAIPLAAVFGMNENSSMPLTRSGRMIFGAVCGVAVFYCRKYYGGFEWTYYIILAMNIVSPLIEKLTKPAPLKAKKVKN